MNLEILDLIGKRLLVGEKKYGNENVTTDGRDFIKEALEESLDLAVYVSAKLIEIKQKENQMGARINMENDIDFLKGENREIKKDIKELQGVVAELSEMQMNNTQVHHVDLVEDVVSETTPPKIEGTTLEPDEEFTPPVGKRKKTTRKKTATVG